MGVAVAVVGVGGVTGTMDALVSSLYAFLAVLSRTPGQVAGTFISHF